MQIWTPRWSIHRPIDADRLTSRIGGAVSGPAVADVPVCAECDEPMPLLLLLAAGPWLPQIPEGHVLLVYKCEDLCDFWESDGGANHCRIVPADGVVDAAVDPAGSGGVPPVLPTIWITDWTESDDGVTPQQAEAIDDPDGFWDLPREFTFPHDFDRDKTTKAGGAPYWTGNGVQDDPPRPRRLLFQLDGWVTVAETAAEVSAFLPPEKLERNGMYYSISESSIEVANFCSDGIGYVFDVTPDAAVPTPRFAIHR